VLNTGLAEINSNMGGFSFGVDSNGNPGYRKPGADTVTPFKNISGGLDIKLYSKSSVNANAGTGITATSSTTASLEVSLSAFKTVTIHSGTFTVNGKAYTSGTVDVSGSDTGVLSIESSSYKSGGPPLSWDYSSPTAHITLE